ncbi:MAG: hypothetical protein RBQ97_00595 [Acholeplasma sp.]|nr:hypothetical protein [Acholeplasma sp.]
MKKTSKRIILSVLTLVLTVVALGTTTFAWFTLGNVSNVSGLEAEIMAGDGLEVRIIGYKSESTAPDYTGEFKNNLSSADFTAALAAFATDFKFSAVTTKQATDLETFKKIKLPTSGTQLTLDAATKNTDYLEFVLEFRSQLSGNVNLTNYEFAGNDKTFDPTPGTDIFSYQQLSSTPASLTGHKVQTAAKNAARVSFSSGATPVLKGAYQLKGTKVGETNEVYAVTGTTGEEVISGNDASATPATYGQMSYMTRKGYELPETPTSNTEWVAAKEALVNPTDGDQVVVLSQKTGAETDDPFYGEVIVRVWIEGWDADAYDSVFSTKLTVNLTFKKVS